MTPQEHLAIRVEMMNIIAPLWTMAQWLDESKLAPRERLLMALMMARVGILFKHAAVAIDHPNAFTPEMIFR